MIFKRSKHRIHKPGWVRQPQQGLLHSISYRHIFQVHIAPNQKPIA